MPWQRCDASVREAAVSFGTRLLCVVSLMWLSCLWSSCLWSSCMFSCVQVGRKGESPVHEHQVISQQSTSAFGPEHLHQAAGVQCGVHVKGMSQLVDSLRREWRWDFSREQTIKAWGLPYTDAPPLLWRLRGQVGLISIRPLHTQEAVGGVSDSAG